MSAPRTRKAKQQPAEIVVGYKGFNADWTCNPTGNKPFQFEVGKTFEHAGKVKTCASGFHFCEYPLDVFLYYAPGGSKFALVEGSGKIAKESSDSKVSASSLVVKAELSIAGLVKAAIEYTRSRCKPVDPASPASSTGDYGAASSTGDYGAASSTGYQGAAMAAGRSGRVMGAEGNALFLVERNDDYEIVAAWAGIAGKEGIKPGIWYTLKDGKPVEVTP